MAFARSRLLIRPGTLELVDRAMALGADVVGGLDPCAVDRDPKGHLDAIFDLAQKYGRPIDLHLHERGEMGAFSIDLTIERVRALGMQGKVTISHAFCLGTSDSDQACRLLDDLARDRVALVITAPEASAAPSILGCIKAGVLIAGGSDGVRDSWNGKRRVVVVMRERGGRTLPFVVRHEAQSVKVLERRIRTGSVVHADEARSWDPLYYVSIDLKRINHEEAYSDDSACTNGAESFFSRIRRAEIGIHHHIAGPHLASYASEMAWREDARRIDNGTQFLLIALAASDHPPSAIWKGYWQRRRPRKKV